MNTSYVQHPGGSAKDFFRDTSNKLPSGTNDLTKDVYRSGRVGVGVQPVSTLDVVGTFGLPIATFPANYTAGISDYTLVKTSAAAGTLTLPAPGTVVRRMYRVINKGSVQLTLNAFIDRYGVSRTFLFPFETVELQSDSTNWVEVSRSGQLIEQISNQNGNYTASLATFTAIKTAGVAQTWTLPTASLATGSFQVLVNQSTVVNTIAPGYVDASGTTITSLRPGESVIVQSNGANWIAISQTKVQPFYIQQTFVANTATVITHNLSRINSNNVQVSVVDSVTGDQVSVRLSASATNSISITSPVALTNAHVTIQ